MAASTSIRFFNKGNYAPGKEASDDLISEIFSFLGSVEFGKTLQLDHEWNRIGESLKANHIAAMEFKKLRDELLPDSLARQLLFTPEPTLKLINDFVKDVLKEDALQVIPHGAEDKTLAVAEAKEKPLAVYVAQLEEDMRPFMERPDQVLPLFHGIDAKEEKGGARELIGIDKNRVSVLCDSLLTQAGEAREHIALFDTCLDILPGENAKKYQTLVVFLRNARALEGFLTDIVFMRRLVGALAGAPRGGRLYDGYSPYDGYLDEDISEKLPLQNQWTREVKPLLIDKRYTQRVSPCALWVLADFRIPCYFFPVLWDNPRLQQVFKQLTAEQITVLVAHPVRRKQISTFGSSLSWFASQNIPIDGIIAKISNKTLVWLLTNHPTAPRLLQSPAVVQKLTKEE